MKQIITGTIVNATTVRDVVKKDGKRNSAATICIADDDGNQLAINVSGEKTNWVGCIGMRVTCSFIIRVFQFLKNGKIGFSNDIYAEKITALN